MSDDLSKLTRDELNAKADELGVPGAAELSTKADVIAAIEAAADSGSDAALDDGTDTDDGTQAESDPVEGDSYRVLKGITVDSGQTYMPGDTIVIDATWPARRAKQLVEQKFLAPEGNAS